ncbi:MAG: hypothetical protein IJU23_04415 [Proteobacteria bacterium]|nr:hypothetical protein [Pseudomonadota bacterium]
MKKLAYASIFSALMLSPLSAFAGDTTEPLDPGTIELAPSFTIDNLHDGKPNIGSEFAIAVGAFEGFTVTGIVGFSSSDGLAGGTISGGVNATYGAVDTDHFDFDVMLDFGYDDGYYVTPSFEFNYDLEPDLALWGLYLRAGLPITGGYDEEKLANLGEDGDTADAAVADVGLELTLGTYVTFGEIFQVLIEGGFTVENLAGKLGDTGIVDPFISIGFNTQVNDNFELITEFKANLPAPDEDDYKFSGALTIGGAFDVFTSSDVPEADAGSDDSESKSKDDA